MAVEVASAVPFFSCAFSMGAGVGVCAAANPTAPAANARVTTRVSSFFTAVIPPPKGVLELVAYLLRIRRVTTVVYSLVKYA